MSGRNGNLCVLFVLLALVGTTAEAKVLRHRATGFRVSAPAGFSLRAFRGIYTIRKGRESATVMRVSSPLNAAGVARSFVTSARMKGARIRGGGKKRIVTGQARGKPIYLEIQGAAPIFKVSKFVANPRRRGSRRPRRFEPLTLRDVAILRRIANSARGGVVSPFQVDIPMRRFAQGGASAVVPNIPGWSFSGAAGGIDGGRPGQGSFALGIFYPGQASSTNPGQVIVSDWSRIIQSFGGPPIAILGVNLIPGTEGVLGPNYFSATYTVRFQTAGVVYDGIMTSGVTSVSGLGLDWYVSYIAVRTGSFPGLGETLSRTWATWDASGNRQSRLAQAIAAIRTTPVVAIDRDVFDRINSAWVEYIRR